ncbi:group II intron reverse transcriptase/maturase (plasmid) [Haloimpatiens sp. FM7330]|uniref:group II intron reverse transcriptase/maturase n=1 Tax=Haloimpatiens sp. FM7330 TaxID=3298610 RepID=UPI0036322F8F
MGITICAPTNTDKTWDNISWSQCFRQVRRLQVRIVKAWKEERYNKVKSLQRLLTKSFSARAIAVKRVTENKGCKTAGIDKILWTTAKEKYRAISELTIKGYHSKPLRRIYIPKKNKKEKRPLGIPTIKDRAMQALFLMTLEPITETVADNCSYGFRPHRSTHDAIEHCFKLLSKRTAPEWILEGDIKGCFDNISHEWLLHNIPIDKKVLKQWLKSGLVYKGKLFPTESGTPQGGIISPTIALIALNGLENILRKTFKQKRKGAKLWSPKVRLVKYADDFIITGKSSEILQEEVIPIVKRFLNKRGLELSKTKTKITHIDKGFDFLGYNIRKYKGKLLIKPSNTSLKNIVHKLGEIINNNKQSKQEYLILKLNPVIRGWCEYYKYSVASKAFYKLDHLIWQKLWHWCVRRHPNKGKKWVKNRYFKHINGRDWNFAIQYKSKDNRLLYLKLAKAGDIKIRRYRMINYKANPFDPEWDIYFEERIGFKMVNNPTKRKYLLTLWKRQNGLCKYCGNIVNKSSGWCLHTEDSNKLLLHPECHQKLHRTNLSYSKLALT